MLIWWLNQEQCERAMEIVESEPDKLPEHLKSELDSRAGRPGRGRLWAHRSLPSVSVDPWPLTELGDELAKDSGGIVFEPQHLELIRTFPGVITDLKLNLV